MSNCGSDGSAVKVRLEINSLARSVLCPDDFQGKDSLQRAKISNDI